MKKTILSLIVTAMAGLLVSASAQPGSDDSNNNNNNTDTNNVNNVTAAGTADAPPDAGPPPMTPPPDAAPAEAADNSGGASGQVVQPLVITPTQSRSVKQTGIQSDFMPPTATGTNGNALYLNFHDAPLEMVLNYLSDAAGFIIVLDTHVNGNVTIISAKPVTRDDAVTLLNGELNKNGYAAIRNDRTLTIVDKNDAKTSDIPVRSGNDPDQIPKNAEIVTQIIPIRFVEARQLVSDLASFVSPQATVVANEAGNSIVITDTQENIRHLAEIIQAIDSSAEAETEIRVFPLKYASPIDVATELGNVFPSGGGSSGNTQSPIRFGGGGFGGGGLARFFGGGGGGGGGAAGGNSANSDRIKKETQVTAVADSRIQAVIVTAPKDLMEEIAQMMDKLDVPSDRDQGVYVYNLKNSDPQQVAQLLQNMFQSSSSSRGSSQTTTATGDQLQTRINNNTTSAGSTTTSSSGFGGTTGGGRTGGGGQF